MDLPICDPNIEVETATVDFKAEFDPKSAQDWCELVKDIVAMANSGGGSLIVGVSDDGTPSGHDVGPLLALDPAVVTDKVHSYTERQFSDFEISASARQGVTVAVIRVTGVRIPMIFMSPGTYAVSLPNQKVTQKTAFSRGTLYFRHGAKSEPGTSADVTAAVEREVGRVKEFWLDGIAKVVAAPPGATVQVLQQDVTLTGSADASPIRLSTDENAPEFRAIQADKLYPYRQTELVKTLRQRLNSAISTHDLQCVRRVHGTDTNPTFSYKSQWSPRQYSEAFAVWIVEQHAADAEFFHKARDAYKQGATTVPNG